MKSSNASRFRAVSIAMDVKMKVGTLEAQTDPLSMVDNSHGTHCSGGPVPSPGAWGGFFEGPASSSGRTVD